MNWMVIVLLLSLVQAEEPEENVTVTVPIASSASRPALTVAAVASCCIGTEEATRGEIGLRRRIRSEWLAVGQGLSNLLSVLEMTARMSLHSLQFGK